MSKKSLPRKLAVVAVLAVVAAGGAAPARVQPANIVPGPCPGLLLNVKVTAYDTGGGVIAGFFSADAACGVGTSEQCHWCVVNVLTYKDPKRGWVFIGLPKQVEGVVTCGDSEPYNTGCTVGPVAPGTYAYVVTTYWGTCDHPLWKLQDYRVEFQVVKS